MSSCSSNLGISSYDAEVVSSSQNETYIANNGLPNDVWFKVYSYMGLKNKPTYISSNLKLVNKPHDLSPKIEFEDVFYKDKFLERVVVVYNFACCCKFFWMLTEDQRSNLIYQASWARNHKFLNNEKIITRELVERLFPKESFKPSLEIFLPLPLESFKPQVLFLDKSILEKCLELKVPEGSKNKKKSKKSSCQIM